MFLVCDEAIKRRQDYFFLIFLNGFFLFLPFIFYSQVKIKESENLFAILAAAPQSNANLYIIFVFNFCFYFGGFVYELE